MIKRVIKKIFLLFGIKISRIKKNNGESLSMPRKVKTGNFFIKIPAGHTLPEVLKKWPYYGTNLSRVAQKLKQKYTALSVIDIGANIGDTVALLRSNIYCPIICIEGDEYYFNLLKENIQQFKQVYVFRHFLDEKAKNVKAKLQKQDGTTRIIKINKGDKIIKFITLDQFIQNHPKFGSAKLLKIDTDGYDLKIIRGGLNYIKKTKPVLFFEYDREYFSKVGDDGLSTLKLLEDIGYNKIIFYDNYGRFLLSTELKNNELIKQLHAYIKNKKGAFPYYDLCIFSKEDDNLAEEFIKKETTFN